MICDFRLDVWVTNKIVTGYFRPITEFALSVLCYSHLTDRILNFIHCCDVATMMTIVLLLLLEMRCEN